MPNLVSVKTWCVHTILERIYFVKKNTIDFLIFIYVYGLFESLEVLELNVEYI